MRYVHVYIVRSLYPPASYPSVRWSFDGRFAKSDRARILRSGKAAVGPILRVPIPAIARAVLGARGGEGKA